MRDSESSTSSRACFSPCRRWRYLLRREVGGAGRGTLAFVCLNPSTADETTDDSTVRRCVGYARDLGYARLDLVNLYAWRATEPRELWHADDPVGHENDRMLARVLPAADLVVAAWGVHARPERVATFIARLGRLQLHALAITKSGAPRHPLYLRRGLRPFPFRTLVR